MSDYEIVDTNADNIDGCSLCGHKNANNLGHRRKATWLKERYGEGLKYKVLRSREFGEVGMIEYAPGNHAWRPTASRVCLCGVLPTWLFAAVSWPGGDDGPGMAWWFGVGLASLITTGLAIPLVYFAHKHYTTAHR
jgi:hypothetical protein